MIRFALLLLASLSVTTLPLAPEAMAQAAATRVEAPMPSLAPMIQRISPTVVNIATRGTVQERGARNPLLDDPFFRRFFDVPQDSGPRQRQFQSAGSGVIIDAKLGHIITNAHVVANATEITVTLQDGRDLKAELVGADEGSDVAVLKVSPERLSQIALGDSEQMAVGDYVVAIGNPFGLQHTVTAGIISGLGRSGINPNAFEDFIQTDASINPGNSGGALVNLRGELIGINSAILSRSGGNIGIGFAIPANLARSVVDQLIRFGSVRRGLLGVNIAPVTPDIAQALGLGNATGALVTQVVEGSAAEKAGIRAGDVITAVNGRSVKSHTELRNAIGLLRVGDKVDIGLLREGQARQVSATVADGEPSATAPVAPGGAPQPAKDIHPGLEGATLADATDNGGVTIRALAAGSPAAASGLRLNDVIFVANRARIGNLAQLRAAAKEARSLVLGVRRGNATVLVPLQQ